MNNMAKQMEMFDDGGLMDEGGTVDPVSGNDVPPGSNQEEVRDDIPAQLSEGEFVFPADVVRYFGLEKLMEMRQEAKMGLQRMEDMGQMGNSEEAIIPDNLPFDIDDIDMEDDELEMAQGGVVSMANGGGIIGPLTTGFPASSTALGTPIGQVGPNIQAGTQVVVYGPDGTAYGNAAIAQAAGVTNYTMTPPSTAPAAAPAAPAGQAAAPIQAASAQFQPAGTKFTPTTIQKVMPTFKETIGMGVPYVDYDPSPQDETEEETESPSVDTTTTTQQPQDDGGSDRDDSVSTGTGTAKVGSISEAMASLFGSKDDKPKTVGIGNIYDTAAKTNDYFGGSKAFGWNNEELRAATAGQGFAQLGSVGLGGMVSAITKELGITDFSLKDVGVAGFTAMNDSLNAMGLTNRGQLMNDAQASLVGNAMAAAHAATYKGEDVTAAYNKVMNTPEARATIDKTLTDIRDSYARVSNNAKGISFAEAAEVARADAATFRNEVNDLANPVNGSARITDGKGVPINTIVDPTTGKRVQDPTKSRAFKQAGLTAVKKAEAKQKQAEAIAKALEDKARADAAKAQRERAAAIAAEYNARSRDYGGGDSGERSGDDTSAGGVGVDDTGTSTGFGSEEDCLTEDMKVNLNGVIDFVTNIKVGDIIDNYRVKEVLHKHMRSGYYAINNELKISNDHPVLANGMWTRPEDLVVGDSINGIPVASLEYVEQLTPTVSIVIDGESFDVHTENNIYTVHGRYREVRQEAA